MYLRMTQLDCSLRLLETIEFQQASRALVASAGPLLAEIAAALAQVLAVPTRKLIVIGYAGEAEAKTNEARVRLALGRAEVVRRLLIDAGLPGDRLVAVAADAGTTPLPIPAHRRVVSFELDPDRPTRADVEAETRRAERWCDEVSP
jgi:flagellar motor protein MotB